MNRIGIIFATVVLAFLAVVPAMATPQIPDRLQDGRNVHRIHGSPLSSYIADTMESWSEEKFLKWDSDRSISSACWRGYIASWDIRDDILHLVSMERYPHSGSGSAQMPLTDLFENTSGPVPATWFSGVLYEFKWRIWYVHPSLIGGNYLAHREFRFENGKLVSSELIFPWVKPCIPYVTVLLPGIGLLVFLRIRRRKSHNKSIQATPNGAPD